MKRYETKIQQHNIRQGLYACAKNENYTFAIVADDNEELSSLYDFCIFLAKAHVHSLLVSTDISNDMFEIKLRNGSKILGTKLYRNLDGINVDILLEGINT